ncbi:hypothetical protein HCN44_002324 [Aphidius gifuensis]|uniref:Uncharacterized protein n=1 Tax=Aphidius gifuensis TaxID=684658 RepID=A0A835CWS4_APHGI|nr:hypothetical protein HCN44_002324 [Aphidius gifuensis]
MNHSFGSSTGDTLCPLGFHPQVRWPTRCKRCYRDYKDHSGKRSGGLKSDFASSTPSLFKWESSPSSSNRSSESPEKKRTWSSTSNLTKDDVTVDKYRNDNNSLINNEWSNSAVDVTTCNNDVSSKIKTRPKSYVDTKNDSSSYQSTFRRHSIDDAAICKNQIANNNDDSSIDRPPKLKIRQVIDNTSNSNDNNVEFIVQVRKTKDETTKSSGKNEIDKLKEQLNEMKARCERVEREKSEILFRRLETMDTVSSKTAKTTEMTRLQKSLKELQSKNEALNEEKVKYITRIKNLEKENVTRNISGKNERERTICEDLKSKLKAAETLCENLMDENEEMKREMRDLEEEIYEMQDTFREEQADEYTNLRKNLDQSNKNCRILSFKLRKIERRADQLENEKSDLESKYNEILRIQDVLRKMSRDLKTRGLTKNSEFTTKLQLKKMLEEVEKELGDAFSGLANVINVEMEMSGSKGQDTSVKYDKLCKEHELLQHKFDNAMKELNDKATIKSSDTNKHELQLLKKKLNDITIARDNEKKSSEIEKKKLHDDNESLKSKLLSLSAEKLKVYNEVLQLKKDLDNAKLSEKNNSKYEQTINDLKKELNNEHDKVKKLNDELLIINERENKLMKTYSTVEQSKLIFENDLKRAKEELDNTKATMSSKITKLTNEINEIKKDRDKYKCQYEEEKKLKDNEIANLNKKIISLEKVHVDSKIVNEIKQNYDEKITILNDELMKGQELFDNLHKKHASLQDVKRKIENENKVLNIKVEALKKQLDTTSESLSSVIIEQKTCESDWKKEKQNLENMIKEKDRLKSNIQLEDSRDEVTRLTKEIESLKIQLDDVKKINDDLSSKLNDYNSVTKIQRNLTADTTALDNELRKNQLMLADAVKLRKTDLAECKMRYENRIRAINDEIQSVQNQLLRYKRERDTYKHMLEGAQKTIDDDEESNGTNVSTLETQISIMEDELSECRLESSKLKTEYVSEKSGWQIKLSEMQSRINELEEERILASGRTKIPGIRSRIELAWQKERDEQQRLLQETATLARDLRQTLYEVERERDKERLENKRRHEQLKKIYDEEKDENNKKLEELQCDLLELRDAHAKLRTSNEKLRREKDRHEREREELKEIISNKRRIEQNETKNMNILLRKVDDLMKHYPELSRHHDSNNKLPDSYTPTPPRRTKGPKSRESSPMHDESLRGSTNNLSGKNEKLEYTIAKLIEVANELRESKKIINIHDNNASSSRKKFGKRSTSIDNDSGKGSTSSSINSKANLHRKSLSLEQTCGKNDQTIWGTDSNISSIQSLNSDVDPRYYSLTKNYKTIVDRHQECQMCLKINITIHQSSWISLLHKILYIV